MSKFKKGDKVRVREGLKSGYCGNVFVALGMESMAGEERFVVEVDKDGDYRLGGSVWWWSEDMLEPVGAAPLTPTGENANYCVCCGAEIPEGRQVCPACESGRPSPVFAEGLLKSLAKDGKVGQNENGQEPHIKDSGKRVEFSTGAVRDCKEGVGRCDLMPLGVVAGLLHSEFIDLINSSKMHGVDCLYDALGVFAGDVWKNPDRESVPNMLLDVSKHFEEGAKKYGENNWQKGIPVHSYIDSAVRHYLKWRGGWTDEPHDRAAAWNILCCIWTLKNKPELDDWTDKGEPSNAACAESKGV